MVHFLHTENKIPYIYTVKQNESKKNYSLLHIVIILCFCRSHVWDFVFNYVTGEEILREEMVRLGFSVIEDCEQVFLSQTINNNNLAH